jgi:NAD+ kinase
MKKIGICYHPKLEAGKALTEKLRDALQSQVAEVWASSAWDEEATRRHVPGTDLLISVGGDGTVLRAARAVVPHTTLLLGVNMGRLGFLTELDQSEAFSRLPEVLAGGGRIEERAMLHADVVAAGGAVEPGDSVRFHALNDVVIGREALGRTVQVSVHIDGMPVADYRADGVIVATATGSTAYSQALGGPILHPEAKEFLVTPVAPHLSRTNSLVVQSSAVVELIPAAGQRTVLSIDGEVHQEIASARTVRVTLSPHVARFIRFGPPGRFYDLVARRLKWLWQPGLEVPADDSKLGVGEEGRPAGR